MNIKPWGRAPLVKRIPAVDSIAKKDITWKTGQFTFRKKCEQRKSVYLTGAFLHVSFKFFFTQSMCVN